MSQRQYKKALLAQIRLVNEIIDRKVMRGEGYDRESRWHKILIKRMERLRKQSFFSKIENVFASIVLF